MLPAFDAARKSIAWANEGIQEIDAVLGRFFAHVKTVEVTEVDPNTGHNCFKVKLNERIPADVERKAFEALQHARNSFDQSLFAACVAISKRPKNDIHFPWRTGPVDLERTLTHKNCRIPVEFWDVLRKHEPYGRSQTYTGGDDAVRELARIANRKHTIGISVAGYIHGGRLPDVHGSKLSFLTMPAPRWDAVKNEMTLVIYSGDVEIKNNYSFAFSVVFNETASLKNIPVGAGLKMFASKAKGALEDLEREAKKIVGG